MAVGVFLSAHLSSFTYLLVPTEDPVNSKWILFTAGVVGDYSSFSTLYIIFLGVSLQNRFRSHIKLNFAILAMPTANGKAWYSLRNVASKLTRMEHHHQFLTTCYEENVIPVGLCLKTNIGFELYDYILPKYTADCNSFIFHRIQQLASDELIVTKDFHEEFISIELDIRRRFPLYIANQLLDRTRTFLASQTRILRKRGRAKLNVLRRKFNRNRFLSRYSDVSAMQRQLNDFLGFIPEHMILKDLIIIQSLNTVIIILTIS